MYTQAPKHINTYTLYNGVIFIPLCVQSVQIGFIHLLECMLQAHIRILTYPRTKPLAHTHTRAYCICILTNSSTYKLPTRCAYFYSTVRAECPTSLYPPSLMQVQIRILTIETPDILVHTHHTRTRTHRLYTQPHIPWCLRSFHCACRVSK